MKEVAGMADARRYDLPEASCRVLTAAEGDAVLIEVRGTGALLTSAQARKLARYLRRMADIVDTGEAFDSDV